MIEERKIPSDFAPPYRVHVWKRKGKRDMVNIINENYVIATVESGTFKEGLAVAAMIVNAVEFYRASRSAADQNISTKE